MMYETYGGKLLGLKRIKEIQLNKIFSRFWRCSYLTITRCTLFNRVKRMSEEF